MPLDDIFYQKEEVILTKAKQLEKRWRMTCYITGVLAWASISILSFLDEGLILETISFSAFLAFQLPLMAIMMAALLSRFFGFIPYKDFSKEDRTKIYYYILITFLYIMLTLICLYAIFFDGVLTLYLEELEN